MNISIKERRPRGKDINMEDIVIALVKNIKDLSIEVCIVILLFLKSSIGLPWNEFYDDIKVVLTWWWVYDEYMRSNFEGWCLLGCEVCTTIVWNIWSFKIKLKRSLSKKGPNISMSIVP